MCFCFSFYPVIPIAPNIIMLPSVIVVVLEIVIATCSFLSIVNPTLHINT